MISIVSCYLVIIVKSSTSPFMLVYFGDGSDELAPSDRKWKRDLHIVGNTEIGKCQIVPESEDIFNSSVTCSGQLQLGFRYCAVKKSRRQNYS